MKVILAALALVSLSGCTAYRDLLIDSWAEYPGPVTGYHHYGHDHHEHHHDHNHHEGDYR